MAPRWNPSATEFHSGAFQNQQPPDPRMFEHALQILDDQISRSPYDLNNWIQRGFLLRELGFPEIAVGDAFKAKLLLDRGPDDVEVGKSIYKILGQAVLDCHCHWEAAELWEEAAKRYPGWAVADEKATSLRELLRRKEAAAASLGGTPQEQKDRIKDGGVFTVEYPWAEFSWTPERPLTRSAELVALINEELRGKDGEAKCYLGPSTLAADENDDVLGMFAIRQRQTHAATATLPSQSHLNKHHAAQKNTAPMHVSIWQCVPSTKPSVAKTFPGSKIPPEA
ncbi:MYND domain [Pyrenophora seminiperda CCB06]|uniref:MYND domain n=1 Tax=Pyrenophora seminiperda CCB06 TaxID=1302712 RepID=A0A3M7M800_9PLEO|nr:MYND domain [Pyrenophora seminiperda CCB06]